MEAGPGAGGEDQNAESVVKRDWIRTRWAYLDYYSAMADDNGGMKAGLSSDGVHPNAKGYAIMAPLAQAAIDKVLAK